MEHLQEDRLSVPVINKSLRPSHQTNPNDDIVLNPGDDYMPEADEIKSTSSIFSIAKSILKAAIPIMIQLFSALFVNNITLHFLGLKDDTVFFDAISLGNNILSCFSIYVIIHTNIGLNAAASQAYGALRYRLVGLYLHRALLIHLIINFATYLFIASSSHYLHLVHIPPNIAEICSRYLLFSPGYIIGVILFDTLKNFLYAHGIFNPQVVSQVIISASYWVILKYFLVHHNMREEGIMLSLTITQLLGAAFLFAYIFIIKPEQVKQTFFFFKRDSFQGLWPLAKIMIGVGAMGYIEVLAYKIQSFASVYFTEIQMAAYVTFLSFDDLYYVLPMGIGISLTSFLGHAVGSRDKAKVYKIIKATLAMGSILLIVLLTLFKVFQTDFFGFYTKNKTILELLHEIGIVYYFFFAADFFQNLFGGILKGIGKEESGTKAFLISVYLIALPLSLVFAFVYDLQSLGMWLGVTVGVYIATSSYIGIYFMADLEEQCNYVKERIIKSEQVF